jgi:hypothetical protein
VPDVRVCRRPGCGKSLAGKIRSALYCSVRCGRAGRRAQAAGAPAPDPSLTNFLALLAELAEVDALRRKSGEVMQQSVDRWREREKSLIVREAEINARLSKITTGDRCPGVR